MKQCIICGSLGDDDSKVCKVCGNPFLEDEEMIFPQNIPENLSGVPEEDRTADVQAVADTAKESQPSVGNSAPVRDEGSVADGEAGLEVQHYESEAAPAPQKIQEEEKAAASELPNAAGAEAAAVEAELPEADRDAQAAALPEADRDAKMKLRSEDDRDAQAAALPGAARSKQASVQPEGGLNGQTAAQPAVGRGGQTVSQPGADPYGDQGGMIRREIHGQREIVRTANGTEERIRGGKEPSGEGRTEGRRGNPARRTGAASPARRQENYALRPENMQTGSAVRPARGTGSVSGTVYGAQNVTQRASNHTAGSNSVNNGRNAATVQRPVNGAVNGSRPVNQAANAVGNDGRPVNGNRPMTGPGAMQRPVRGNGSRPVNGQARPMGGANGQRPVNGRPPMNMQGGSGVRPVSGMSVKLRTAARRAMRSPLLMLVALLQTVYLAGSVAAIFMKELNFSQFVRLIADVQLPPQMVGYMDDLLKLVAKLDTNAVGINLIVHVPDLLLCLGLWLIVFMARTKKEEMSGTGFLLMKVVVIIGLIKMGIVMLAGLIISVALVVSAWASGMRGMIITAVVTLILMIIVTMLVVMYYFSYLGTIKTFRKNAVKGESYGKASAYVAVVYILSGLTAIIGILSGIVNSEISNIVGSAGKLGWMLLFALWIFWYRRCMAKAEE